MLGIVRSKPSSDSSPEAGDGVASDLEARDGQTTSEPRLKLVLHREPPYIPGEIALQRPPENSGEIAPQEAPESDEEPYFPDVSLRIINSVFVAACLGVVFMTSIPRQITPVMADPVVTGGESRPITARLGPDLRHVPVDDVGIGYRYPYKSDLYTLVEMSTGKGIVENTLPVYVDEEGERYVSGRYLIVTSTSGQGVYLRRTPQRADRIRAWPDGTKLRSTNETTWSEDRYWFGAVDPAGNRGWVPSNYVRPLG